MSQLALLVLTIVLLSNSWILSGILALFGLFSSDKRDRNFVLFLLGFILVFSPGWALAGLVCVFVAMCND